MSGWNFGNPTGGGDQWKASEHVGRLVAFVEPSREVMDTQHGQTEATKCRYIVILDGSEPGTVFDDAVVFGNISKDAFSGGVEKIVLGRVAVGEAKPGKNAPFILNAATDEDKLMAGKWFDDHAALNSVGRVLIG